jgi:hypothetical protein
LIVVFLSRERWPWQVKSTTEKDDGQGDGVGNGREGKFKHKKRSEDDDGSLVLLNELNVPRDSPVRLIAIVVSRVEVLARSAAIERKGRCRHCNRP